MSVEAMNTDSILVSVFIGRSSKTSVYSIGSHELTRLRRDE